ncbi:MAG: 23S rRNA (uracil(1939)-C(5))-methyltransferase RlmD [Thermodesulfobacteriota bacterium]
MDTGIRIDITSLAYGGSGVGRLDGKVVFVPYTVPGDHVRVDIISEKKGFYKGRLLDVLSPSSLRFAPFCPLFGRCGGCQWQHISYPAQVDWKVKIFKETIERLSGVREITLETPISATSDTGYRTRVQFHVMDNKWGFFESASNRIVEVEECPVLDPLLNETFTMLRDYLRVNARHLPIHTVEIGVSELDRRTVAIIHTKRLNGFDLKDILNAVQLLKGVEVFITPSRRKGRLLLAEGDRSLAYEIKGLNMRAGISRFTQVNLSQNSSLVDKAVEYADALYGDNVLDLYSGVGNISLPLARKCREVLGIEKEVGAVEDGISNIGYNSIKNVRFICSEASNGLNALDKRYYDIVILDPPRGGAFPSIKRVAGLRPKKIVYVSCNPATLARDLSFLVRYGYKLERMTVIDMFPHTYHIEGIVKLLYA